MPARHIRATVTHALLARFAAIRAEHEVPQAFPDGVVAEAERAVATARLPADDATDVPFVTIDPPGSMDLDQALHIQRRGRGFRVRYAIADVPAFVAPGGEVDAEARRRGQTIYSPDTRTPLHPAVLSEGAASLLPGQDAPAFVWDLRLEPDGSVAEARVLRAMVRSRARYTYAEVQAIADSARTDDLVAGLAEVGRLRAALEQQRGGASLPMPEQDVVEDAAGHYHSRFRPPVPAEEWNAQISLMTGMAAAELMVQAHVGILRTMPEPDPAAVARFRRSATAMGVPWEQGQRYGDFLRSLDRTDPAHLALVFEATGLFRGAGYTPIDGDLPKRRDRIHAAVGAEYAHVTAPLRRLVDRFGLVVCAAVSRDEPVPGWARAALGELPEVMAESGRVARAVERASADAVEAAVLADRVGETFDAAVIDISRSGDAVVRVLDPAVIARAEGAGELGQDVRVRLVEAQIATSTVRFEIVDSAGSAPHHG